MRAVCNLATALVLWLCVSTTPLSAGEFEKPGALARPLALSDGSPVHITGLLVDMVVAFPPYAVVCDGLSWFTFPRLKEEFGCTD